ncbi:hypothetical protein HK098_001229 [Nowakowskiella sp. JEL0407]|nr:hypothetical protein HK098_001229 [Nowakowskiella sp. JEL0407]
MGDILTPELSKALRDRTYDKRKSAAMEIEILVRKFLADGDKKKIRNTLQILVNEFVHSNGESALLGGLIGLAAASIALGCEEVTNYYDDLVPPMLSNLTHSVARVRYYALESLYNFAKVARNDILRVIKDSRDDLQRLLADSQESVRSGAELLDKLLKRIVKEETRDTVKLIKNGKLPVRRMKVILLGKGEAGKTSLLRALRGESFCESLDRTQYMELFEVEQHDLDDWKEFENLNQITKALHIARNEDREMVSFEPMDDENDSNNDTEFEPSYLNLLAEINFKTELFVGDFATLSVYDFAGQDEYSTLQQIFVTSNTLYIIVFNLKKMFSTETAEPDEGEVQIVLSWLSTIHLRAPEAKIIVVGTQVDGTPFDNEDLPEICEKQLSQLETRIRPAILNQLECVNDNQPNDFIFLASAKTGFQISDLKRAIESSVHNFISGAERIPLGWIQLQDEIAKRTRENKCRLVYSLQAFFDEWLRTDERFGISSIEDLQIVLAYFHKIGVVLYFPENEELRQYVFPDPRALINVLCAIFKWSRDPPRMKQVDPSNREWIRNGLLKRGYWSKSTLYEVLRKNGVQEVYHASLILLLREFDLCCELRSEKHAISTFSTPIAYEPILNSLVKDHAGEVYLLPCILLNDSIGPELPDAYSYGTQQHETIDLILSFPKSALPKGIFHQLAIRFASKSSPGYKPILYLYSALVSIGEIGQMILTEELAHDVITLRLFLKPPVRVEFKYAWMIINSTVELVLSEHWSRRVTSAEYTLSVKCPIFSQTNFAPPHAIKSLADFDSPFVDLPVFCDRHVNSESRVILEPLREYWFREDHDIQSPIQIQKNPSSVQYEKTIMLSYCWGKKSSDGSIYPDQELVKKLASKLEERNFSVWLDIRYMKGNLITTMKRVIEDCAAVIACVTNDYHKENSNAYDEFIYACAKKRDRVIGVKLTPDADMMGGAYGFKKGFKDLFYDLSGSDPAEVESEMDKLEKHLKGIPALQS